jgi:hypothetical protein
MSTVRRRGRLSNAPRIPAVQRAQRNLCLKLGLLDNELLPVEAALQDYIAMFHGPLPQDVIAALTAICNINDDNDAAEIDRALAGLVDDGIAELQEGVVERQMEVGGLQTGAGALHAAA